MSARLARLHRDEGGTTVVEFALVAPALLLVLVVALDFARALNALVTITNASREAARYAIVHPLADAAAIHAYVARRIAPLDPAGVTVTLNYTPWTNAPGCVPACWSSSAPAPGTVAVSVRYRWDAAASIVGTFFSAASGSLTFDVSTSMEVLR